MNFWLTGARHLGHVRQRGHCNGWMWGARDWSNDLLSAQRDCGTTRCRSFLKGEAMSWERSQAQAAQALGLAHSVQVVAGGGDNAVAACGVGAMNEGGRVCLARNVRRGADRAQWLCPDGGQRGAQLFATQCHSNGTKWGSFWRPRTQMNWLGNITGGQPPRVDRGIGGYPASACKLDVLPLPFGGEGHHIHDSAVRAGFVGLDIAHTPRRHDAGGDGKGVCFALRDSPGSNCARQGPPRRGCWRLVAGQDRCTWVRMLGERAEPAAGLATKRANLARPSGRHALRSVA